MAKRPPTQKEIQEKKKRAKTDNATLTIQNISKQTVPIHTKPRNKSDFYVSARDVQLRPMKMITLPKSRLWDSQIKRLEGRRIIKVIRDSEKVAKVLSNLEAKKEAKEAKSQIKTKKKSKKDPPILIVDDKARKSSKRSSPEKS